MFSGVDRRCFSRHGFSLLELLLVLVIILLFLGAGVFSYRSARHGAELNEGSARFENLVRYAGAEAARTGRRLRLQLPAGLNSRPEASTNLIRVSWEPNPLRQPGVFEPLTGKRWMEERLNELIRVVQVRPLQASSWSGTATNGTAPDSVSDMTETNVAAEVTFYPDGSSDSVEIILASRDPEDQRRCQIRLSGITRMLSSRLMEVQTDEDASMVTNTPAY